MDYKNLLPIFCFDVSKQSERLKTTVADIQIRCRFNTAVSEGTTAFAVMISDRKIRFKSDGEKMSVVF